MWSEPTSSRFAIVVAASIVAHVVLLAVLPSADDESPVAPPPRTLVTFETTPLPPPPPPPAIKEPVVVPDTVAARVPTPPKRSVAPRHAAPQVAAQPKPAATDAPMDFSGVTLSNEGSSWSSPTGNGEPMTEPIAAPGGTTRPGPVRRVATGTAAERVVAVGDLSRPPRAPNLDAALVANYPSDARRAGTPGTALVRARILADGRVGTTRVISETAPGFGVACQRTLAGSHWEPPLDASKRPVITDINYTCTFAVTR